MALKKYHKLARMVDSVANKNYVVAYNVILDRVFLCSDKEWQSLCLLTCNEDEEKILTLRWWERRGR